MIFYILSQCGATNSMRQPPQPMELTKDELVLVKIITTIIITTNIYFYNCKLVLGLKKLAFLFFVISLSGFIRFCYCSAKT